MSDGKAAPAGQQLISGASRHVTGQPTLTRRQLLAGTGAIALLSMPPTACAPVAGIAFSDGTFWDDGLGWSV